MCQKWLRLGKLFWTKQIKRFLLTKQWERWTRALQYINICTTESRKMSKMKSSNADKQETAFQVAAFCFFRLDFLSGWNSTLNQVTMSVRILTGLETKWKGRKKKSSNLIVFEHWGTTHKHLTKRRKPFPFPTQLPWMTHPNTSWNTHLHSSFFPVKMLIF